MVGWGAWSRFAGAGGGFVGAAAVSQVRVAVRRVQLVVRMADRADFPWSAPGALTILNEERPDPKGRSKHNENMCQFAQKKLIFWLCGA